MEPQCVFGARASTNLGMLHTDIIICLLHRSADKSPHNSGHKITSLGKHTANIAKRVVFFKLLLLMKRIFVFCQFKYFSPNNCDSTRSVFTTIVMKHERTGVPYKSEVYQEIQSVKNLRKLFFLVFVFLVFSLCRVIDYTDVYPGSSWHVIQRVKYMNNSETSLNRCLIEIETFLKTGFNVLK